MANKKMNLTAIAGAVALCVSSALPAADAPELMSGASARMLSETCAGCHGTDGQSVGPASPTIGGMNAEYFVEIMQGFRSGEIYSTIMGRLAKGYTDEEIALMAGFFAGRPFQPAKQGADEALASSGAKLHDKYCEKCHAEGGKVLEDEEYYILAGQWTPYLENALEDFKAERRPMPKKMAAQFRKLLEKEGDAGLTALLAYYASLQ
jgi:sulfide dehydrogenase cytochrome subunit